MVDAGNAGWKLMIVIYACACACAFAMEEYRGTGGDCAYAICREGGRN